MLFRSKKGNYVQILRKNYYNDQDYYNDIINIKNNNNKNNYNKNNNILNYYNYNYKFYL